MLSVEGTCPICQEEMNDPIMLKSCKVSLVVWFLCPCLVLKWAVDISYNTFSVYCTWLCTVHGCVLYMVV